MKKSSLPRFVLISLLAIPLGAAMAGVAQFLMQLIGAITNFAFYGRLSWSPASPAHNHLGLFVMAIPVIGGLIVGIMARYGSKAIRGHGIPEAMEQVLENKSRIPARITWLKPLSAAISIGTGGPFGAEGPIIATGGAGGSLLGQLISTTAAERKTLLAAGAAAGMAATFGSPVSAVLLAVELLLFEFKARSFVPVALASAVAAGTRLIWTGAAPVFPMPTVAPVIGFSLLFYLLLGAVTGGLAVGVTKLLYIIEDGFEHLPINWMWWPALGAVAVGVVGYFEPRTLGVGYDNISHILEGSLPISAVALLCLLKFISWSIALGSGTSGGTLAPLLTVGSGIGFVAGILTLHLFPHLNIDPHLAALVGMAALFGGASQATLASAVFAFETTGQTAALIPLLAACAAAFLVAKLLSRNSIMTEKIDRRGVNIPQEYSADIFQQTAVGQVMEKDFQTIPASLQVRELIARITAHDPAVARHQALLLVDENQKLAGIITRGDLLKEAENTSGDRAVLEVGSRNLIVTYPDESLHDAIEKILQHQIGRLPVVARQDSSCLVGYLSRASVLSARWKLVEDETHREPAWRPWEKAGTPPLHR
ncbi:MAG: chloride channel protein [Chthoniobacterales bacterium]